MYPYFVASDDLTVALYILSSMVLGIASKMQIQMRLVHDDPTVRSDKKSQPSKCWSRTRKGKGLDSVLTPQDLLDITGPTSLYLPARDYLLIKLLTHEYEMYL